MVEPASLEQQRPVVELVDLDRREDPGERKRIDRVDEECALGNERPRYGRDHALVVGLVCEVAERREEVDDDVERLHGVELAHVGLYQLELDAGGLGVVSRQLEGARAQVEPGDAAAAAGERNGDPAPAAGEVEHAGPLAELESLDEKLDPPGRPLRIPKCEILEPVVLEEAVEPVGGDGDAHSLRLN